VTSNELSRLRQQITYEPARRERILDVFADVAGTARSVVTDTKLLDAMQRDGRWKRLAAILAGCYEAVTLLVGSELDTETPGERGLGRLSTRIPRLGGAFRSRVARTQPSVLGAPMEDLCIAGFAAGAVIDAAASPAGTLYRARDLDALVVKWMAHGIGNWEGWSEQVTSVVAACVGPQLEAFSEVARANKLTTGLRAGRKQQAVDAIGFMLVAAGRNLLSAHGAYNDHTFESMTE
jgi:hypothetical protein